MALLSNIAGTEQVALTKINACISTVNLFGGGAVGKIATKSSANDFDIFYAENAFNQKSTTSLAIGTGNKDFDIGGSQWDDDFNFRVRAFSIASPGNYMEGTISALIAGYGVKTWRMVVDTVVGSGTFADWQFQVLGEIDSEIISIDTTSFPNDIFSTAPVLTNGNLSDLKATLTRNGKQVTINGYFTLNATTTGFDRTPQFATLQSDYAIKNGTSITIFGNCNFGIDASVKQFTGYLTNNDGSASDTVLYIKDSGVSNAVVAGDDYNYSFSISYLIA